MDKTKDDITVAPEPAREPGEARLEKAAEFLASHGDTSFTYEEERAVLRRVDYRVLPLLLGAYFFQQLDKSTLRYVTIRLGNLGTEQSDIRSLTGGCSPIVASRRRHHQAR